MDSFQLKVNVGFVRSNPWMIGHFAQYWACNSSLIIIIIIIIIIIYIIIIILNLYLIFNLRRV